MSTQSRPNATGFDDRDDFVNADRGHGPRQASAPIGSQAGSATGSRVSAS